MNYGKAIVRMGREVVITDLYSDERYTVITDSITTPLGKLIVRRALSGLWNDGLN